MYKANLSLYLSINGHIEPMLRAVVEPRALCGVHAEQKLKRTEFIERKPMNDKPCYVAMALSGVMSEEQASKRLFNLLSLLPHSQHTDANATRPN